MDIFDKRPTTRDRNMRIKRLAEWLGTQIATFKKPKNILPGTEIYDMWNEFVNDDKYRLCLRMRNA